MSRLFYVSILLIVTCSAVATGGAVKTEDVYSTASSNSENSSWSGVAIQEESSDEKSDESSEEDNSATGNDKSETQTGEQSSSCSDNEEEKIPRCPRNEEYVKEKRSCPPDTCFSIVARYDCSKAPPPKPGCVCKPGFKRLSENSGCVPLCQCPQLASTAECQTPPPTCNGPNEIFVQEKSTCPGDACRALVIKVDCSKAPPPKPGCTCKPGFLRKSDVDSPCVPICECPEMASSAQCQPQPTCNGPNEEFVQEKSTCPGDTCRALVIRVDCTKAPPPKPGCTCKSGYFRKFNETSPCVPICECPEMASSAQCQPQPTCNGPNEEFVQEKSTCPGDTCKALVIRVDCTKAPPPQPGCTCKSGYFRKFNETSPCVPICECPEMTGSVQCSTPDPTPKPLKCGFHEVEACLFRCPPEKTCRNRNIAYRCMRDNTPCKKKCVCEPGYFRNSIGECVTKAQCEKCSKPNEFFSCGSACDNECINIQTQNRTNCPIYNKKCNEKCYCDDGYARDDKGNCIPVSECKPKPLKCGRNEEEICSTGCPPAKTCENRNIDYACPAVVLPCKRACECKAGYYRNAIGECITKAECAKCSKPNEFFSCGGACDNECKNIDKQSRTNCPIKNIVCNKKCYCKNGYARDDKGNCIQISECVPPKPKYMNCGLNEVESCEHRCVVKTCRNRKDIILCKLDPLPCQWNCVCKPGYFRNSLWQCVSKTQCEKCPKPNEFFLCGSACDNECKNIHIQNRTNCPIRNKTCNEKCYCDDGYARDEKGNCIRVSECSPSCSDPNEEYVLGKSCPPDLCVSLVARYKCDSNEVDKYRCRCKSGYLRVKEGSPCVPIRQCPEMADSPDCIQEN